MDIQAVTALVYQVPLEVVAALAFVGLIAFDAYRSGTGRATAIAVALPISQALYALIPHTIGLSTMTSSLNAPIAQLGIYVVIFAGTVFLLHRMLAASFGIPSPFTLALLAGASVLVILIVTILQVSPLLTVLHPSVTLQSLFATPFQLLWLIGAYVTLAFVRS